MLSAHEQGMSGRFCDSLRTNKFFRIRIAHPILSLRSFSRVSAVA